MARTAHPWFWEERNGWYVNKDGQRHFLGEHTEGSPLPRKTKGRWNAPQAIVQAFHTLMARHPEACAAPVGSGPTIAEILDKYLDWCGNHRAPRTYEWYHDHIQSFLNSLGAAAATLTVADLKPFQVIEWVDAHADWSSTYKRGAIVAIQRPFNWAEELGYIAGNPVKKIKKPQPRRRDNPVTPEDFTMLLAKVQEGDPFRDLLLFAWHTGCRPQEARHIEPRHVQLDSECIVIPKDEAKGKRQPRVIILHGPALEIITRLMRERSEGKLFLNAQGRPWKKAAICNRFDRLSLFLATQKLKDQGIRVDPLPRFNRRDFREKGEMVAARKAHEQKLLDRRKHATKLARQHAKGFAAYDLRHGFCQRLLENGANHLAVAELMGHSNGNMVSQTYSHMNRATAHLKETLTKAAGGAED